VTIVIPTYNRCEVLCLAIASVIRQTYGNWELIVVGDACTDDSEAVVGAFADHRIRWVNLTANSGSQSLPNMTGIRLGRGDYVAYLGHDDLWLPHHLTRLIGAILSREAGLAMSVCLSLGAEGSNIRWLHPTGTFSPGMSVPPSALLHRRDVVEEVGGWRDYRELDLPPDLEFLTRATGNGRGWTQVEDVTVCKFNSALRPNSYVDHRSDEQAAAWRRIRRSRRRFVRVELDEVARLRASGAPERPPAFREMPGDAPPGWLVEEWRRVRGLPPNPL